MNFRDVLNRDVILAFDSKDPDSEDFAERIGDKYDFVKVTPTSIKEEPQLCYGRGKHIQGMKEIEEFLELLSKCKAPKARPNTKIKLEAFLSQH